MNGHQDQCVNLGHHNLQCYDERGISIGWPECISCGKTFDIAWSDGIGYRCLSRCDLPEDAPDNLTAFDKVLDDLGLTHADLDDYDTAVMGGSGEVVIITDPRLPDDMALLVGAEDVVIMDFIGNTGWIPGYKLPDPDLVGNAEGNQKLVKIDKEAVTREISRILSEKIRGHKIRHEAQSIQDIIDRDKAKIDRALRNAFNKGWAARDRYNATRVSDETRDEDNPY